MQALQLPLSHGSAILESLVIGSSPLAEWEHENASIGITNGETTIKTKEV